MFVIPGLRTYLEPGLEYWANIVAVYYSLLDRPGQRCHTDTHYSFTECVEVRGSLFPLFTS